MDEKKCDCAYEKWVDNMAAFLKEQRHGSNLIVLIHSGPGQVEAMYSTPDAALVLGMCDIARLSLESQLKAAMTVHTTISKESPGQILGMDKMKVN